MTKLFTTAEQNLNSVQDLQTACAALKTSDFNITAKVTTYTDKGVPRAVILKLPESLQREIQMFIAYSSTSENA